MIESYLGIPVDYIVIGLAVAVLVILILLIINMVRFSGLKKKHDIFMKGKTAKSLEDTLIYRLEQMDDLIKSNASNERNIKTIFDTLKICFQKFGLVKYDALDEMGGKLSCALCLLNDRNDGYIINIVHSREGCYNYIKEIIDGNSIIGLSDEEADALEKALGKNA
ncbi:MAG: DUF4446 family protein [Lachnospiraceae bacterium]|nr:DUF4446 family protein [Lachnospiraceae bacterium]